MNTSAKIWLLALMAGIMGTSVNILTKSLIWSFYADLAHFACCFLLGLCLAVGFSEK